MHTSVKRIRAALGDDIEAGGHGVADDGGRSALGDAQFLNRIVIHCVDERYSLVGVVTRESQVVAGVSAIHHEVVTGRWEAIDGFAAAIGLGAIQAE